MRAATFILLLCACNVEHRTLSGEVQYRWDGDPVLCSRPVDDEAHAGTLTKVGADLNYAVTHSTAALMHAHVPQSSISLQQLDCILDLASDRSVQLVTYSEFAVGHAWPRPALALSFDDDAIDAWYAMRDWFSAKQAHVTFFVTEYASWTDQQRAELAELASRGHEVQSHGMYHLNAVDYVAEHGIDDYLQVEVLPSIELLEQAGYPITTFAFPGGAANDEIIAAVLEHVPQVRVTRAACPY